MMDSWDASEWAPWRSRRATMFRRRRTLSVYEASAPIGSVFLTSSSTADWAKARAWATVRLQDRDVVWVDFREGTSSDVRVMVGSFLRKEEEKRNEGF
jgi:hypothetical protein